MVLYQLLKTISKGWKIILIISLVAMGASLVYSLTTVPQYRSQATFIIAPNKNLPSSRDVVSAFTALDTLKIFSTYTDIMKSDRVFEEAIKMIDLDDVELSKYSRQTEMNPESIILILTVEGPNPQTTATLANEIGKYGIQYINAFFTVFEIDFLDPAVPVGIPFKPQTYRDMGIAAGIGLFSGLLIVIVQEYLQTPISQFIQMFSLDTESSAFTKRHLEKSLVNMKAKGNRWPITFFLIKMKAYQDLSEILPGLSKKKILYEITKRLKGQLKGNDLVGRWDEYTFAIVLPNTPQKASTVIEKRLLQIFESPITFGVEDEEQVRMNPVIATTVSNSVEDFETFVFEAEEIVRDKEWK